MPSSYYATFASGLQEVIKSTLPQYLSDVKIDLLLDGLVVYQTDKPIQQVKRIRFFNNTFLLLHLFKTTGDNAIQFMINSILRKPDLISIPRWGVAGSSFFRIMASRENQTVSLDRTILAKLESFFSHRLNLRVNRSKPDVEIWFLTRSEGYGFVGLRVTTGASGEKNLQKGELKPELSNVLCLLSEPSKDDVFLDPFAGSGAIPIERAQILSSRQIFASDLDPVIVQKLQARASSLKLNLTVSKANALKLDGVKDNSIGKIVTDPPWGMYAAQDADALNKLYVAMLLAFCRVLKEGGLLVVLMGQKEIFEAALSETPAFLLLARYDILVSGKKAAIYKIKKQVSAV